MSIAKKILIQELNEQGYPEKVEDVIFWALEYYAKSKPKTRGRIIAYAIKERILEGEKKECEHPYHSVVGSEKGLPTCLKCNKKLYEL